MAKNLKKNVKTILEAWSPMIQRTTGVKDPEKLEWLSQLADNQAKNLNEADGWAGGNGTIGGAFQNAAGAMGGVYAPYNTLYNTVGVGNAIPAQAAGMTGAAQANPNYAGSGDKWPALLPLALKVAAKTIGFELVNTVTLQGPTGVLGYLDYVYSGSKQPYGATPAYSDATANPHAFQNENKAYSLYGLPHAFKATVTFAEDNDGEKYGKFLEDVKFGAKLEAGMAYEFGDLKVEFIGWSRIDGDPMFKVVDGKKSLGDYFTDDVKFTPVQDSNAEDVFADATIVAPRLISILEDHVQGFTGSGPLDKDPWYGTYQDGKHLFEPMLRGTGELQYGRQLSLQVFTKNIQVGTISVSVAVTQEQVTDLQKQWGIDVLKMVENAAVNELSQTINRHITSRLFALGWKNHAKLFEVEGNMANLNMTFDTTNAGANQTVSYAIPQADGDSRTQTMVSMPVKQINLVENAAFENRDTLIKRIMNNMMLASNWILQRGRFGAATFAVTNLTIASMLQTDAQYTFSPLPNNIAQTAGSLYPIGTLFGMTIYVDPLMSAQDCRVLVGRKGGKEDPGVVFAPYLMAESVKMIAEGTAAPKVVIKSRYALVDVGFFPETSYLTFYVDPAKLF